jgi:hypothetical protein
MAGERRIPERGEFEVYDMNKLPDYAGAVTYHTW